MQQKKKKRLIVSHFVTSEAFFFFPSVKSKLTSLLRACILDADMNFRLGFCRRERARLRDK